VAAALVALARQRGGAVALRHKQRGAWRAWTWRGVAAEVERLLAGLESAGEPRTLFAFLAAQALGSSSAPLLGDGVSPEELSTLKLLAKEPVRAEESAPFALAESRVQELGVSADDHVVLGPELGGYDEVDLLYEWLVAGFVLHVPEHPGSILADTREVAPTYVAASARRHAEFWQEVSSRLGARGSRRRRLVEWALARRGNLAAELLVLRPLRRNLGLARVRRAVVVGGELPQAIEKELRAALPTLRSRSVDSNTTRSVSGAYPVAGNEVELSSALGGE
jgi:hypothetical protein